MLIQAMAFAFSIIFKFFCLPPPYPTFSLFSLEQIYAQTDIRIRLAKFNKSGEATLLFYLTTRCEWRNGKFLVPVRGVTVSAVGIATGIES